MVSGFCFSFISLNVYGLADKDPLFFFLTWIDYCKHYCNKMHTVMKGGGVDLDPSHLPFYDRPLRSGKSILARLGMVDTSYKSNYPELEGEGRGEGGREEGKQGEAWSADF